MRFVVGGLAFVHVHRYGSVLFLRDIKRHLLSLAPSRKGGKNADASFTSDLIFVAGSNFAPGKLVLPALRHKQRNIMRGLFVFATLAVAIPTQAGPVGKRLLLDGGMAVGGVEEAEVVDLSRLTNSEGKTKNEDKYPLLLLPGFTGSSLQSK